jgi:hypothetical protein
LWIFVASEEDRAQICGVLEVKEDMAQIFGVLEEEENRV